MSSKLRKLLAIFTILIPVSAHAETIWLGETHGWSVGSAHELPLPYCRLVWQGDNARTVEFRQGQNFVMWLVSENGWKIAPGTKTEIAIMDRTSTNVVPAERFSDNTLQLWGNAGEYGTTGMKMMIGQAFFAKRKLRLGFAADEQDWIIPLADLPGLYQTYVQCLHDLSAEDLTQSIGPAGDMFHSSHD